MVLWSGSIFVIRKLRIWPVRRGSAAAGAAVAPFQRACSMEVSEERSGAAADRFWPLGAAVLAPRRQVARMPSPSSTVAMAPDCSTTRPETMSPSLCSVEVFVEAGGDELLHAELDLALFGVDGEDLGADDLADVEDVLRMIDAAVGD